LAKKLFLVSDLHMGGDGRLQHCDYTGEFLGFLKKLECEGADTKLLIVGDTFGFWETTLVHGAEKLNYKLEVTKRFSISSRLLGRVSR
jgi:UDP-2,3-diacylglucosamine pyrophosphatase LpxH